MLERKEMMESIGLMIEITGKLYCFTVSSFSKAYMEYCKDDWIAWRGIYIDYISRKGGV